MRRDEEESGARGPDEEESGRRPEDPQREPQEDAPTPPGGDAGGWDTRARHEAWRADEPGALDALCQHYWPELVGIVQRHPLLPWLQRKGYEAEDLAQDVCIEFMRRGKHGFVHRGKGSLLAWLRTIAHNHMVDLYRNRSSQKRGGGRTAVPLTPENVDLAGRLPDRPRDATPTSIVRRNEMEELSHEHLSDDEHFVWYAIDVLGHTSIDVSEMIDRSDSAVRGLLFRARHKLQELFDEGADPEPEQSPDTDDADEDEDGDAAGAACCTA